MTTQITDTPTPQRADDQESRKMPQTPVIANLLPRVLAAVCLALAVLAGTASLTGVVEGFSWFPYLLLPVFTIHLLGALIRSVRVIRWLALPATVLAAIVAIANHDAMTANTYGFSATQWFFSALSEAGIQLATQVPPVASSIYVDFAVLVLAMCVSLIVELLATFRRTALLSIIVLSFAPIVASLFKQEGAGIGYLALLLIGILGFVALLPHIFKHNSRSSSWTDYR
ncbi:transglutaminaseTgpA domain-containing protein [Glutamicibacter ectropisis]|uniref:TransglutaminaseTgpA domain-containing protein n=1 Tax=Glutamicibacter ectropisis TaxID=3046593 RepID=A0AAU6WEW1_9MICC